MVLGKYFIERVYEVGFSTVLNKKVDKAKKAGKKNFLEEFLKNVLVYSSQHEKYPLVSEICSVIMEKESNAMQIFVKDETYNELVCAIIHFKDNHNHRALHYAKLNHRLMNGLALLHLEKVAHGDDKRKDALLCIRHDDDYYQLDPWLTESYQTIHPSVGLFSQIKTYLIVAFTVIPSIILVYFDLWTDIVSCISYGYIAFDNSTEIEQACLSQLESKSCLVDGNYSCYDTDDRISFASRIFTNGTCDESNYWTPCIKRSAETIDLQYRAAFVIMLIISILSCSSYIGIAFNTIVDAKLPFHDNLPSCINQRKPLLTSIWWFLSILFWPLSYAWEVKNYRLDPKFKKTKELKKSKKSWKLLKNLENGFENYYQILLQLYLLSPYLRSLSKLPLRDLVNWDNFISTFSVPNVFCSQQNVQAALGKLLLSTISLSIGLSSRQATKEGEPFGQSVKNLVLAVSYFFLCYARIMSILPLFSLEHPFIALMVFTLVHSLINYFTLWCTNKLESFINDDSGVTETSQSEYQTNKCHIDEPSALNGYSSTETNGVTVHLQSEYNTNVCHEDESTSQNGNSSFGYNAEEVNQPREDETNDCNQSLRNCFLPCKRKIKSFLYSEKIKTAMSCLASHTFIITFHEKSSEQSFVIKTLFKY